MVYISFILSTELNCAYLVFSFIKNRFFLLKYILITIPSLYSFHFLLDFLFLCNVWLWYLHLFLCAAGEASLMMME